MLWNHLYILSLFKISKGHYYLFDTLLYIFLVYNSILTLFNSIWFQNRNIEVGHFKIESRLYLPIIIAYRLLNRSDQQSGIRKQSYKTPENFKPWD